MERPPALPAQRVVQSWQAAGLPVLTFGVETVFRHCGKDRQPWGWLFDLQ
jgi:hypothetical protein